MADEKRERGGIAIIAGVCLATLLIPTFYVLSIGPAGLLVENGYLSQGAYEFFFWPVFCVAARWPWAADALMWYGGLWGA